LLCQTVPGIGEQCLITVTRDVFMLMGFVVLAEGLDMFSIRAVATGERGLPSGNLSHAKRTVLDGCLGVKPRKTRITLAEGLHDWGKWAMPLLNYTLASARKGMENPTV
jgi:hypothetical protein